MACLLKVMFTNKIDRFTDYDSDIIKIVFESILTINLISILNEKNLIYFTFGLGYNTGTDCKYLNYKNENLH